MGLEHYAVTNRHFKQNMLGRWRRSFFGVSCLVAIACVLSACSKPRTDQFEIGSIPLSQTPASLVGVTDGRARFREIFCHILAERQAELPDHRTCDVALTHVTDEKPGSGVPVDLAPSRAGLKVFLVPGIGWDCFADWLAPPSTAVEYIRDLGYEFELVPIEGLSSSSRNARIIRDTVLDSMHETSGVRAVIIGYSKGAPDSLEAVATFPELRSHVAAVVSVAGAVWGSPIADAVEQSDLELLRYWPGATCTPGDGGGVASLRPGTRATWMAEIRLPKGIHYYSLVSLPDPENISAILRPNSANLSALDPRNDGQLLLFDQFVPGSTFLGYLNADHWAMALPIARSHRLIGSVFVNRNAYPREALLEAILRSVEENLGE